MKQKQRKESTKHNALIPFAVVLFLTGSSGLAQFGGDLQLSPEQQQAAWALEAKSLAREAKLSDEVTENVVAAYRVARGSHQKALQEAIASGGGGGGFGHFQGTREVNEAEAGKLQAALGEFLQNEQLTEIMATLGTFNREWDVMVDTLAGFELGEEGLYAGLQHVNGYVLRSTKALEEARANFDFESMRSAREEIKGELDTALASILSEEQLAKWKAATARRRGFGEGH